MNTVQTIRLNMAISPNNLSERSKEVSWFLKKKEQISFSESQHLI